MSVIIASCAFLLSEPEPVRMKAPVADGLHVGTASHSLALIYGGINEDQIGEIAKKQARCVPGKIVNGKKTVCKDKTEVSGVTSPFPAA